MRTIDNGVYARITRNFYSFKEMEEQNLMVEPTDWETKTNIENAFNRGGFVKIGVPLFSNPHKLGVYEIDNGVGYYLGQVINNGVM